jgi:hypothetical protein
MVCRISRIAPHGNAEKSHPMSLIRLLSTDFDGTLDRGRMGGSLCTFPCIRTHCDSWGGGYLDREYRPVAGKRLGRASEIRSTGLSPEYILTSERHIYHPDGKGGWHDYGDWNRICREHHDQLFEKSGDFFEQIRSLVVETPGVILQRNGEGVPEGLIAESEEILDDVTARLNALPGREDDFHYQRSNIYLRFCHRLYDKGSTLAELGRLLDMPTTDILAVG